MIPALIAHVLALPVEARVLLADQWSPGYALAPYHTELGDDAARLRVRKLVATPGQNLYGWLPLSESRILEAASKWAGMGADWMMRVGLANVTWWPPGKPAERVIVEDRDGWTAAVRAFVEVVEKVGARAPGEGT